MPEVAEIPVDVLSPEYIEGERAYRNGIPEDACPYPKGDKRRTGWFSGHINAGIGERHADLFARNNLTWP